MLAITVSIGRPSAVASWPSVADFPTPGSPHSSTGRFAAMASASASAWLLVAGSVPDRRVRSTRASARAIGSGSVIGVPPAPDRVEKEVEVVAAGVGDHVGDALFGVL